MSAIPFFRDKVPHLFLSLWMLPGVLGAQALGLDQARREAQDHSPLFQRTQSEEREADWGRVEALSEGFLPHLSVKAQHFLAVDYPTLNVQFGNFPPGQFPGIFPKTSLALDASFDLFDGFRNIHRLDAANHGHEAAKLASQRMVLDLGERVALAFYRALAAQMLSEMADQNVKTLEDHDRIAQEVLKHGQATRYDLLRVEVQLSEAKSDQVTAHDNVVLAREALSALMGLKDDRRPLEGKLPVPRGEALLQGTGDEVLAESPDLRIKQFRSLAAGDQSAAAQASLFPRVSVIGEYQWYNSPDYLGGSVTDSNDYRNSYFLGASATWDLLDGGSSIARAGQAGERAKQAQADYEEAKLAAPRDLHFWKRRLLSSSALYRAKLVDVEKAKESARLATAGFRVGTRTTADVLDAEFEQYRAAAGVVSAQIDALEALVQLELVLGRKVPYEQ